MVQAIVIDGGGSERAAAFSWNSFALWTSSTKGTDHAGSPAAQFRELRISSHRQYCFEI